MRRRVLPSTAPRIHIGTLVSCRSGDSRLVLCIYLFAVPDTHSLIAIDNKHEERLDGKLPFSSGLYVVCVSFPFSQAGSHK